MIAVQHGNTVAAISAVAPGSAQSIGRYVSAVGVLVNSFEPCPICFML